VKSISPAAFTFIHSVQRRSEGLNKVPGSTFGNFRDRSLLTTDLDFPRSCIPIDYKPLAGLQDVFQ
jgi:hypothetical protein